MFLYIRPNTSQGRALPHKLPTGSLKYRFACRRCRKAGFDWERKRLPLRKNPKRLLPMCLWRRRKLLFWFLCRSCRKLHFPQVCLPQGNFGPCKGPIRRKSRRYSWLYSFCFGCRRYRKSGWWVEFAWVIGKNRL